MKNLSSYLSAGIAVTATLQSSDAATVVTFYGPGARTPSTSPATPAGISMIKTPGNRVLDSNGSLNSFFAISFVGEYFTAGSDIKIKSAGVYGIYADSSGAFAGGAQSGSANYANISFNGNDGVYEAVAQFSLNGFYGGYLVALAISDSGPLSISQGKLAIDAAAVPEPSAIALLSLGAGGLMLRRRRKVA